MWTLIVVSTFWVHGAARHISTYEFYPVKTEARCVQLKSWIDARERKQSNGDRDSGTTAQCVREQ